MSPFQISKFKRILAFSLFILFLFNHSLAQNSLPEGIYYEYKIKEASDASYPASWETLASHTGTVSELNSSVSYTAISRVCDKHELCSDPTNDSSPVSTIGLAGKDMAIIVSGNGTQDIVLDFLEILPKETSYTLYSDKICSTILTTFASDANARASNVSVSGLSATDINYFWIKENGASTCRRLNFAYKMTDPCAGLAGGEWVWVPPLSDGIGDGLSTRASQLAFTNPNGLCVTKYIVSADDSDPTCASTIGEGSQGGVTSSNKVNCKPISDSSKRPWVNISQTEANAACKRLGTKYRLLTNAERMTIALNTEADYRNWSNQIGFASGEKLNKGHADTTSSSSPYFGPRSADEGICLLETSTCTLDLVTNWHQNRRTFYVKNGVQGDDVIWDLAGNVWTWSLWSESLPNLGTTQIGTSNGWQEWTNSLADAPPITKSTSLPQNIINTNTGATTASTFNLGRYSRSANASTGALLWGASWNAVYNAGLFALNLYSAPTSLDNYIGFICSFGP